MKRYVPPYSEEYSHKYDELWTNNPVWKPEVDFVSDIIGHLIKEETQWLDAGCGTGYFLKQYKHVYRAGFDLSETMLDIAKKNNPDIAFLELHDISKEKDEWNNSWDLITCAGQPWSYLGDIRLIEKIVENFYNWLKDDSGICFLAPDDVQEAFNMNIPYHFSIQERKTEGLNLNALIFDSGIHTNIVYPLLDQWVRWFSKYFWEINIENKKFETHSTPRTYIICRKKKIIPNSETPDIRIGGIKLQHLGEKYGWDNLTNHTLFH